MTRLASRRNNCPFSLVLEVSITMEPSFEWFTKIEVGKFLYSLSLLKQTVISVRILVMDANGKFKERIIPELDVEK